jgi:CheY-like chemotaxis protein
VRESPVHALVIEDQYLIAFLIEDELRELGYTSFEIVDREEDATQAAIVRCPDLITADDRITDGTGVAAVQEICVQQVIPVVFIVGSPDELVSPVPFAALLEKPFAIPALHDAIGRALVSARRHGRTWGSGAKL